MSTDTPGYGPVTQRKAAVIDVTTTIPAERLDAFNRLMEEFHGGQCRYDHESQAAAQAAANAARRWRDIQRKRRHPALLSLSSGDDL